MTLAVRNSILRFGASVAFLLIAGYTASVYYIIAHSDKIWAALSDALQLENPETYMLFFRFLTIKVGVIGFGSVVMVKLLARYFRKTTAPEVFFFIMCLLLLVPEMLRPAQPVLLALEVPGAYAAIVTRLLYFSHSLSVMSFFAASLFVVGIEQQRNGIILAVAFALSIGIAYVIPVDSLELGLTLAHNVGFLNLYRVVHAVISGLTVLNFLSAALGAGNRDYIVLGLSAAAFLVGRLWGFWTIDLWQLAIAAVILMLGALIFGIRCYNMYLWK